MLYFYFKLFGPELNLYSIKISFLVRPEAIVFGGDLCFIADVLLFISNPPGNVNNDTKTKLK